jgi:hypothetical protein
LGNNTIHRVKLFADQGVNLANVDTIALGLGNKNNPQAGGSGKMCFDDIRLYRRVQAASGKMRSVAVMVTAKVIISKNCMMVLCL